MTKRIRQHYRTYVLKNGQVVKRLVKEHQRTNKPDTTHRANFGPHYPAWFREMQERLEHEGQRATERSQEPDSPYISPEDLAATAYMERQRRLLHQYRRRK